MSDRDYETEAMQRMAWPDPPTDEYERSKCCNCEAAIHAIRVTYPDGWPTAANQWVHDRSGSLYCAIEQLIAAL